MPRVARNRVDANVPKKNASDAVEPQSFDASIKTTPAGDAKMVHPDFEVVNEIDLAKKEKLERLKFMNEMVTVDILPSANEDEDFTFIIEVNEQKQLFHRGQRIAVKRYFVEGLARAKPVTYGNQERLNPTTGEREYYYPARRGERYPFAVHHDPNPLGPEWLRQVRAQP